MVEDLLAARGIIVSHQTLRLWTEKFGRHLADEIRRRSASRLGENVISMKLWLRSAEKKLALAGCRSGWFRSRRADAEPLQYQGQQAADAKAS